MEDHIKMKARSIEANRWNDDQKALKLAEINPAYVGLTAQEIRREERIKERKAALNAARSKKQKENWQYKEKTHAEQVELALTDLTKQFIDEIKGVRLHKVELHLPNTIKQRKEQVQVYLDSMNMLKRLKDLLEMLRAQDNKEALDKSEDLIVDAEKLLAQFMSNTKQ